MSKKLKWDKKTFPVIIYMATSTLVIFAAALFSLWDYYDPEKVFSEFEVLQEQSDENSGQDSNNINLPRGGEPDYELPLRVNILFLGLDRTEQVERFGRQEISDSVQTDAIIFATIDIRHQEFKAITVSRDAKVPIAIKGINDKINHAYRHGLNSWKGEDNDKKASEGIRYAVRTIENLMGAPVNFYVVIDIDDLISIVDMMGGIYHDVEQDIRADLGLGRVLIEEGYQHLDGEHFFYYVQYRDVYERHGDRMNRHQRIMKSAFEQFNKTGNISKAPAVFNMLKDSINTNLETRHLGALLRFTGDLKTEDIEFYSFIGEGIFTEYGYYYYLDEEHRASVIDEMLGVEVGELGIVKGIPYEREEEDDSKPGTGLGIFDNGINIFND